MSKLKLYDFQKYHPASFISNTAPPTSRLYINFFRVIT